MDERKNYPDIFDMIKDALDGRERSLTDTLYAGPEIEDVYNGPDPDIMAPVYAGPDPDPEVIETPVNLLYAGPDMMWSELKTDDKVASGK